jgi:hypothetical protein
MARIALLALVTVGLAACSQNEAGKKVITEQCIADGGIVEVCECLARESDAKLDKPLFDIIVMGAQGMDVETAERIEELEPQQKAKLATVAPQILNACGAEGYLATSGAGS